MFGLLKSLILERTSFANSASVITTTGIQHEGEEMQREIEQVCLQLHAPMSVKCQPTPITLSEELEHPIDLQTKNATSEITMRREEQISKATMLSAPTFLPLRDHPPAASLFNSEGGVGRRGQAHS